MISRSPSYLRSYIIVLQLLILHAGDGCGTLGGNPEQENQNVEGASLKFFITDAPVEDAKHVWVTVESLAIATVDTADADKWLEIPLANAERIDLLSLRSGISTTLGNLSNLPPGTYGQTRLILSEEEEALLVDADGVEHLLKIPGAERRGIKIKTAFTLEAGSEQNLTIDFDLRRSIKFTGRKAIDTKPGKGRKATVRKEGKYVMKPVLRLVENRRSGAISGSGVEGSTVCAYARKAAKDLSSDCDNSENSTKIESGRFTLAFLKTGVYDLRIFSADGSYQDVKRIRVRAGKTTELDENRLEE